MVTGKWCVVDIHSGVTEECKSENEALEKAREIISEYNSPDNAFSSDYINGVFVCIKTHFTYRLADKRPTLAKMCDVLSDT